MVPPVLGLNASKFPDMVPGETGMLVELVHVSFVKTFVKLLLSRDPRWTNLGEDERPVQDSTAGMSESVRQLYICHLCSINSSQGEQRKHRASLSSASYTL